MDLSDHSFLKRRVGKPDSRARGGIHTWFGRFVLSRFFSPHLRMLREFVWAGGCVTVPVAWASGPSTLASRGPWGRRCRGTRDTARSREPSLVARRPGAGTCGVGLPPGAKSVHRLAKMVSWSCFGPFVYTVAPLWTDVGAQECTQIGENGSSIPFWGIRVHCCDARIARAASGGTSASTAMACRRRSPIGGRLSLGRKNRLCASGAVARLASSPRQQPMHAPEEPFVFSLKVEALVPPRAACPPCAAWSCARPRGPPRGRATARRAR